MQIVSSSGYECEKELPTTLEDLFNKSDVLYNHEGKKRKLNITYVRYFEEYMKEQNIYNPDEAGVPFYHLCALLILMKNNGFVDGDHQYYNDTTKFLRAFNQKDIPEALSIYKSLQN